MLTQTRYVLDRSIQAIEGRLRRERSAERRQEAVGYPVTSLDERRTIAEIRRDRHPIRRRFRASIALARLRT